MLRKSVFVDREETNVQGNFVAEGSDVFLRKRDEKKSLSIENSSAALKRTIDVLLLNFVIGVDLFLQNRH